MSLVKVHWLANGKLGDEGALVSAILKLLSSIKAVSACFEWKETYQNELLRVIWPLVILGINTNAKDHIERRRERGGGF